MLKKNNIPVLSVVWQGGAMAVSHEKCLFDAMAENYNAEL
jgi:hypothetical protein